MRGCASVRECACPSFSGSLPLARFPFCPRPEKLVLSRRDLSRRWSDEHGRHGLQSAEDCLRVPLARRHQGRGKRRRGTCQWTQVLSAPVTEPCAHWRGESQLRGRGSTLNPSARHAAVGEPIQRRGTELRPCAVLATAGVPTRLSERARADQRPRGASVATSSAAEPSGYGGGGGGRRLRGSCCAG